MLRPAPAPRALTPAPCPLRPAPAPDPPCGLMQGLAISMQGLAEENARLLELVELHNEVGILGVGYHQ